MYYNMEYNLNLKTVINENRTYFLKKVEIMKADVDISKRQLTRFLNYLDNVIGSGNTLKKLLDNPRFVNRINSHPNKNLFYIDNNGKPVFSNKKEIEEICNTKIQKQLKLINNNFEKYFNSEIPIDPLCRPVEVIHPESRLWYREVVKNTSGQKYLLEIALNCVITELIENYKDLSVEYMLVDSYCNCNLRDENNKTIKPVICKNNFLNIDNLKKTLFCSNSVSCIYAIEIFKIGEGKFKNYDVYNDILRPIPLPDDELFALFDGVDLKSNKSTKNKNKQQKPPSLQLQSLQLIEQKIIEEIEDDTIYISSDSGNSSDSDGENNTNEINKIEPVIQVPIFNIDFNFNTTQKELCDITEMLYNLYDKNDNFCKFITDNNYLKIVIIKGLHYDTNQKINSLHFTAILIEHKTNKPTRPYHFYIKNDVIVSITEIRNLL